MYQTKTLQVVIFLFRVLSVVNALDICIAISVFTLSMSSLAPPPISALDHVLFLSPFFADVLHPLMDSDMP